MADELEKLCGDPDAFSRCSAAGVRKDRKFYCNAKESRFAMCPWRMRVAQMVTIDEDVEKVLAACPPKA